MATEINVKIPPLAQAQIQPKPAPANQLPQKPASKTAWVHGMVEPEPADTLKVPDSKPDVIVFIKTRDGYQKAMEIDKGGDSLFGSGAAAGEFTEILTEAISQKLSVTCKTAGSQSGINAVTEQIAYVRQQLDEKKTRDEFAMILLGIGLAAAVLVTISYLVIGKIQNRRR